MQGNRLQRFARKLGLKDVRAPDTVKGIIEDGKNSLSKIQKEMIDTMEDGPDKKQAEAMLKTAKNKVTDIKPSTPMTLKQAGLGLTAVTLGGVGIAAAATGDSFKDTNTKVFKTLGEEGFAPAITDVAAPILSGAVVPVVSEVGKGVASGVLEATGLGGTFKELTSFFSAGYGPIIGVFLFYIIYQMMFVGTGPDSASIDRMTHI